ncbi:MAG: hypothetical protein INQ03_21540 [Candidatus Heimdallarchaeota archaeon]|nr:hypothetical protein [Candidatus Heimdallarchaeota archaeon]
MSIEDRIYERLRAAARIRDLTRKGASNEELDKAKKLQRNGYQEKFTDLTPSEIKQILTEEQIAKKFYGLIGAGKEANVYHIKDFKNRYLAVKMFRINTSSHSISTVADTAKLGVATGLCLREFENLADAYRGGVRTPKPIWHNGFFYAAEMVGGKYPAPLLTKINLKEEGLDPVEVLDDALEQLDIIFNKAEMVHGDYLGNLLLDDDDQIQVIDFYQSRRWHPEYDTPERIKINRAMPMLKKDIEGLLNHFKSKYRVSYDPKIVFKNLPETKVQDAAPDQLMTEFFSDYTVI